MTLQQLRYLIKVAECASLGAAAGELHVSQPSLSIAIRNLEKELGRSLFNRSAGGMTLTLDGLEFLGYARQLLQQVDAIAHKYKDDDSEKKALSISTQHYTFIVDAFIQFCHKFSDIYYSFNYRETTTSGIIEDVRHGYSELGILFCSSYNQMIMRNIFNDHDLIFDDILWQKPHILISRGHPLAAKTVVQPEDLKEYPCVTYDRGRGTSTFFAEEVLCERPCTRMITVTDRSTMASLLNSINAYNISTGVFSSMMGNNILTIPLDTEEYIRVIYIRKKDHRLSPLAEEFLACVHGVIKSLS